MGSTFWVSARIRVRLHVGDRVWVRIRIRIRIRVTDRVMVRGRIRGRARVRARARVSPMPLRVPCLRLSMQVRVEGSMYYV